MFFVDAQVADRMSSCFASLRGTRTAESVPRRNESNAVPSRCSNQVRNHVFDFHIAFLHINPGYLVIMFREHRLEQFIAQQRLDAASTSAQVSNYLSRR